MGVQIHQPLPKQKRSHTKNQALPPFQRAPRPRAEPRAAGLAGAQDPRRVRGVVSAVGCLWNCLYIRGVAASFLGMLNNTPIKRNNHTQQVEPLVVPGAGRPGDARAVRGAAGRGDPGAGRPAGYGKKKKKRVLCGVFLGGGVWVGWVVDRLALSLSRPRHPPTITTPQNKNT